MTARFTLAALAALCVASPALAAGDVFGLWKVESGKAIVEISPCGESACGKIAWLQAPNDDAGKPKVDFRNPDAALQSRPLCGLPMIGDFAKDGEGGWKGGFIYNAEEGKTYKSVMRLREDGTLNVRGYVGIELFGKSQVWTRVADNSGGC